MSLKKKITQIIEDSLESDLFLVDLSISNNNDISLLVDGDKGVDMSRFVFISKQIKNQLNDLDLDYSLVVSSTGIDRPLTHDRQYAKNIGRIVAIKTDTEEKLEGKLVDLTEENLILCADNQDRLIKKNNILETKILITF